MKNSSKVFKAINECSFKELQEVADYILSGWNDRIDNWEEIDKKNSLQFAEALADYGEAWLEDNYDEFNEFVNVDVNISRPTPEEFIENLRDILKE